MTFQAIITRSAIPAALLLAGCFTPTPPAANYLLSPAKVTLERPLFITVTDARSPAQREASSTGYWRYISEPEDGRNTTFNLANDVSRALRLKGMVASVIVLAPHAPHPPEAMILEIMLRSWYGRVPDRSAQPSESFLRVIAPGYAAYAEGQCRIDAKLRSPDGGTFSCGRSEGNAVVKLNSKSRSDVTGRLVSAMAADQAMAQLLRQLEKGLATFPQATLRP